MHRERERKKNYMRITVKIAQNSTKYLWENVTERMGTFCATIEETPTEKV